MNCVNCWPSWIPRPERSSSPRGPGSRSEVLQAGTQRSAVGLPANCRRLERKAAEKQAPTVKEAYSDFAAQARKLANTYEKRANGIDDLELAVAQQIRAGEREPRFRSRRYGIVGGHSRREWNLDRNLRQQDQPLHRGLRSGIESHARHSRQDRRAGSENANASSEEFDRKGKPAAATLSDYRRRLSVLNK